MPYLALLGGLVVLLVIFFGILYVAENVTFKKKDT